MRSAEGYILPLEFIFEKIEETLPWAAPAC